MSWIDSDGTTQSDFIEPGDIKDSMARGFELEEYIDETNQEVIDLCERKGVRDTSSIETDPLHYKLKRYAIVFMLMRLYQDKIGVNNNELADMDKYVVKYNLYKKELMSLEEQVSYPMITGSVSEKRDRVKTVTLWRG